MASAKGLRFCFGLNILNPLIQAHNLRKQAWPLCLLIITVTSWRLISQAPPFLLNCWFRRSSKKASKIRVTAGTINQTHVIRTFDVSTRKEIKSCGPLSCWIYCRESVFTLFVISQHWIVTGRWKNFPLMPRTYLFYTVNIKTALYLAGDGRGHVHGISSHSIHIDSPFQHKKWLY